MKSFIKGAVGEELVARQLSQLSDSYSIYHGVGFSDASVRDSLDIDHVGCRWRKSLFD